MARVQSTTRLLLGVAVILVGVLLTLDNAGVLEAEEWLLYWPVALIAVGLARVPRGTLYDLVFAAVWVGLGAWILLWNLDRVPYRPWDFLWPIVFLLLGLTLTMGALGRRRGAAASDDSSLSAFALMGGSEQKSSSRDFQSADATAIMGGCCLDLRHARIADSPATIHAFAFWGGVEISVPAEWRVTSRALPILGAVEDTTTPPPGGEGPELVLQGFAIMGAIEVKNGPPG